MSEEFPFFIGALGGQGGGAVQRTPIETPEGISGQIATIISGGSEISTAVQRAVSLTQVKALDLIGEGEIKGLVTGEYSYVGKLGDVGYQSVTFTPFPEKTVNGIPVRFLRSVYWNETPVLDKDNLFNFQQINVQYTNGRPNGSSIDDIEDDLSFTRVINDRLRGPNSTITQNGTVQVIGNVESFAKTYRILNRDCKAANVNIRISALSESIVKGPTAGDVVGASVTYGVYFKPLFTSDAVIGSENVGASDTLGFLLGKKEEIIGKISYGYIRSSRIQFPDKYFDIPNFIGWEIKIFRTTPDSIQGILRNQTFVDSITEIYGENFCYPNSVIISQKFSAEYFSQIPTRAFDVNLLKIKVPSNYDPIQKSYLGDWDGTFKDDLEWSDNPAWCFFDLVTNKRYGLGKYISEELVDKWTLYEIGKYCDTMVADGYGGVEPRFSCNLIITSREEAYKVLNDMASIFRAIVFYSAGGIYSSQDAKKTPLFTFTNSNVENGDFQYSSSSKRVRHSIAVVRYNDKNNFFKPAVEYVEDVDNIKRYGIREVDVTAFGCTSRGQAIRFGKWALISEGLETNSISFIAGLEGSYLRPGDVFQVYDANKHQYRHGGRTSLISPSAFVTSITLDDEITFQTGVIYNFSLVTPSYNYEPSLVDNLSSNDSSSIRRSLIQTVPFYSSQTSALSGKTTIVFDNTNFQDNFNTSDYRVSGNLIWTIESSGVNIDPSYEDPYDSYRVIQVQEKETHKFSVAGLSYSDEKFDSIENALAFEAITSTEIPSQLSGINLVIQDQIDNSKYINYSIVLGNTSGITSYLVYAREGTWQTGDFTEHLQPNQPPAVLDQTPDSRYLINILPVSITTGVYVPIEDGSYYFRAYSRNVAGLPSAYPVSNNISVSDIKTFQSLKISALRLQDQTDDGVSISRSSGNYSTVEPVFFWQAGFTAVERFSLADVKYRITVRKSTYTKAINRATQAESPNYPDDYKPSSVIYFEQTGYAPPADNLNYTFKLQDNINAFAQYALNNNLVGSGIFREYDLVVEAHLGDGESSAGGNFTQDVRGGVGDSSFENTKGYDIMYVYNPPITGIALTNYTDLPACLTNSNPNNICTDQWFNSEGEIKIDIRKGALPIDTAGGFVYSCPITFSKPEAYSGITSNGFLIRRSEFVPTSPISTQGNLLGNISGFIAVSLFDTLDQSFRDTIRVYDPLFDVYSGLALSNSVLVKPRGALPSDKFGYRAWIDGRYKYDFPDLINAGPSNIEYTSIGIDSIQDLGVFGKFKALKIFFTPGYITTEKYSVNLSSDALGWVEATDPLINTVMIREKNLSYITIGIPFSTKGANQLKYVMKTGINFFVGILDDEQLTTTKRVL